MDNCNILNITKSLESIAKQNKKVQKSERIEVFSEEREEMGEEEYDEKQIFFNKEYDEKQFF